MGAKKSKPRYNNTNEINKLKRDLANQEQANATRLAEIEAMKTNQAKALKDLQNQAEKTKQAQKAEYERQERERKKASDQ